MQCLFFGLQHLMEGGGVVEDKEDICSALLSGVAVASMDDVGGRVDVVAACMLRSHQDTYLMVMTTWVSGT